MHVPDTVLSSSVRRHHVLLPRSWADLRAEAGPLADAGSLAEAGPPRGVADPEMPDSDSLQSILKL